MGIEAFLIKHGILGAPGKEDGVYKNRLDSGKNIAECTLHFS
jgi:hypothetical protein